MGSLRIKFWGSRGLFSAPSSSTAIFGGNTPCAQVLYKNHLILVDTGFGVSNLGEELINRILVNREELLIHILFTHFHWDHIQGLPFFSPIYFESSEIRIYSPLDKITTHENLDILFDGSYSPFSGIDGMMARINIHQLRRTLNIDGLKIDFHPVDHGADLVKLQGYETYAYRFTTPDDETLCFITDHEARKSPTNDSLIEFARDCDVLVHDGQYNDQEYQKHRGWGHSSVRSAIENARAMNAGKLLITHHDPYRADHEIQAMHRKLIRQKRFEGMEFEFVREEVEYLIENLRTKTTREAG